MAFTKNSQILMVLFSSLWLANCAVNPNGAARHSGWYEEPSNRAEVSQKSQTDQSTKTPACPDPYRVQLGDTLSDLALKCRIDMLELAKLNLLEPPFLLRAGETLVLSPRALGHVGAGKTQAFKQTQPAQTNDWIWPMGKDVPYTYPLDSAGRTGLSFFPQLGQPVYAVEEGRVAYAGEDLPHYGKLVVLKHTSGYVTVYAYNHRIEVVKDQLVKAGDIIARAGQTGDAKKPELYFEARYLGRKVNVKGLFNTP